MYSLRFKIKITFGHKLRYVINVQFGKISLKLRQTNWNVAKNDVNVVADELSTQIIIYTWYLDSTVSMHINAVYGASVPSAQIGGLPVKLASEVSILLWTPWLVGKRLVRAIQCTQFRVKSAKNDLKPTDFPKVRNSMSCMRTTRTWRWSLSQYQQVWFTKFVFANPCNPYIKWTICVCYWIEQMKWWLGSLTLHNSTLSNRAHGPYVIT